MAQPERRSKAAPTSSRPARRGRPTADRALTIDASIREAAFALFMESGFETVSMDAVALRAPVSKATLYARYESKEQLFRAVMEDELKRLSRRAGERDHLLPAALEPRLREHARRLVEVFSWPQFQAFIRLIGAAEQIFPEIGRAWRAMSNEHYLRFLGEDIHRVGTAQGVSRTDADFFARLFLNALGGWHLTSPEGQDDAFLAFADRVVDVIVAQVSAGRAADGDLRAGPA